MYYKLLYVHSVHVFTFFTFYLRERYRVNLVFPFQDVYKLVLYCIAPHCLVPPRQ